MHHGRRLVLACALFWTAAAAAAAAIVMEHCSVSDVAAVILATVAVVAVEQYCIQRALVNALKSRQCNQAQMQLWVKQHAACAQQEAPLSFRSVVLSSSRQ